MAIYNTTVFSMRILLSRIYYPVPHSNKPHDVEGTVLQIVTDSEAGDNLIRQNKFLEIVCQPNSDVHGSMQVRWDNDVKTWIALGSGILRSCKLLRCNNIWEERNKLEEDNRPFKDLRPRTTYSEPLFAFGGEGIKLREIIPTERGFTYDAPTYNAPKKYYLNTVDVISEPKPTPVDQASPSYSSELDVNERWSKVLLPPLVWEQ